MGNIKIKTKKGGKVAFIEHTGPYQDVPYDEYYGKLYDWAKENRAKPGFKTFGIFHDDPEKTPPEQCRSEIGIPLYGTGQETEEVKVKDMPEMEVAVLKFKGEGDEYPKAYHEIADWINANGYEWTGSPIEVYTKKPKVKDGKKIMYANIMVPVKGGRVGANLSSGVGQSKKDQ